MLRLGYFFLGYSDNLTEKLPAPNISTAEGQSLLQRSVAALEPLRNKEHFGGFWK